MVMFRENKNNLSTISSTSTTDSQMNNTTNNTASNMELIYENVPQRHLIKTQNRIPNSRAGAGGTGVVVVPPGQILVGGSNGQYSEDEAKRLTQSIAAIAAQRKATQHHKDLMLELGQVNSYSNSQQLSPANSNSPNNRQYNPNLKTSNGDENANNHKLGQKKKVKIKEIVQYKLPDDSYQNNSGLYDEDYELVSLPKNELIFFFYFFSFFIFKATILSKEKQS